MKVKLTILLVFFMLNNIAGSSAQEGNIWCFGGGVGLDFNSGSPVPFSTAMRFGNPCAAVADDQGKLLFYTNGVQVWNRQDQVMPHGDTLIVDPALPPPSQLGGIYPATNYIQYAFSYGAVMIVPMPDRKNKYYLFLMTSPALQPYGGRLYYRIINMELDNGLGDVEPGCFLLDSNLIARGAGSVEGGPLTGVVGDRCNVWLLVTTRTQRGTFLKAYSIDGKGIDSVPVLSNISISSQSGSGNQFVVSSNRKKLAFAANVTLFDFDPYTGKASNGISLFTGGVLSCPYAYIAFSPDNTKLYCSSSTLNNCSLDQYDLSSGDSATMAASRTKIADDGGNLRLGPDGRIYISHQNLGTPFLYGTIDKPNLPGAACTFLPNTPIFAPGTGSNGFCLPTVVPVIKNKDTVYNTLLDSAVACAQTSGISDIVLRATDTTGWNYEWNDGTKGYQRTVSDSGTYWVRYYDRPCRFYVDSFKISFFNLPLQDLGPDTSFCEGDPIALNLSAETIPGASVLWSTGETALSITATDTGIYWVNVAAAPCFSSDSIHISAEHCECFFNMPNAFSPNGDGLNDIFMPSIEVSCPGIRDYLLNIYNRYGQRIYSSSSPDKGWNGTQNGMPADAGTYFYEFHFKGGTLGKSYYRKGDITLIR